MNLRTRVGGTSSPLRLARTSAGLGILGLLLPSCTPRPIIVERPPQAYYQTGFPIHDTSRELERTIRSLKRIQYTAVYRTYAFTREAGVTDADDLTAPATLARAADTLTETESKGGTAAILFSGARGVALLTNHHVVHYPAVRIQYFDEATPGRRGRAPPRRVASVAIRMQERGALADHLPLGTFDVLARDTASDLALVDLRLERTDSVRFSPMPSLPGDPSRLSWGSFLYVLGYPRGYSMVTVAIVSDPNRDRHDSFLTNGLWNEGISGGVILAIRGDNGNLEWVGIARAGVGAPEVRVQPRPEERVDELDLPVLYPGPLFVESVLRIQYGITFSVPMTRIRDFISENRSLLVYRGYDLRGF
jgi:hypothetical protein